ncbi:MAG: DinB family protein [Bacteroidales bacterium]|nr:DinB family protein [Bacteroidales bacterium]
MEQIKQATKEIIDQLKDLAEKLSQDDFTRSLPVLMESSIGMHYRHIIEFYEVMISGAGMGEINYDSRKHDPELEGSREKCLERLEWIRKVLTLEPGMKLKLSGSYIRESDNRFTLSTNLERELVYNIEHAIHHMAIIRIALQHEFPDLSVSEAFGYAYSTLKHMKK